jgi:hypothetical protein
VSTNGTPIAILNIERDMPASRGNRSPRTLAKTAKGWEEVAAWLKLLENHGARLEQRDPMASYDFGWMWA